MLTKKQAKRIRSLRNKKYRELYGEFIAEGEKIIREIILSNLKIHEIFATSSWLKEYEHLITENIECIEISSEELKSISFQKTPNNVLSVVKIPKEEKLPNPKDTIILVTDSIQDPGNLGTIIRTCDWFGITNILASKDTVDLYNYKVIQSTMGSFCRIKIWYTNIADYLEKHTKTVPVYGSFIDGENAFKQNFPDNLILVVGNESKGISPLIEKYITRKITIPAYNKNNTFKPDSLNASVASAILMALLRK